MRCVGYRLAAHGREGTAAVERRPGDVDGVRAGPSAWGCVQRQRVGGVGLNDIVLPACQVVDAVDVRSRRILIGCEGRPADVYHVAAHAADGV